MKEKINEFVETKGIVREGRENLPDWCWNQTEVPGTITNDITGKTLVLTMIKTDRYSFESDGALKTKGVAFLKFEVSPETTRKEALSLKARRTVHPFLQRITSRSKVLDMVIETFLPRKGK